MKKELEVKILGIDLEEFENRLIEKGATLHRFEKQINILFDPPILQGTDSYLRIRTTKDLDTGEEKSELTLKVHEEAVTMRTNREYTTPVEDPETMMEILRLSGLGSPMYAEKIRKSYLLRGAIVELDRWDEAIYPNPYAEIEVNSEDKLEEMIELLGIDPDQVSTKSIRQLMEEITENQ